MIDTPVILTEALRFGYGGSSISAPVDFTLDSGIVTAIIGRNGIGKSTFIKTITGRLPIIVGKVLIDNKPLDQLSRKEIASRISLVSTSKGLEGGLRLHEFVALGRTPYTGLLGILSENDRLMISEAIDAVGINHKKECFVGELSDGEHQKAQIARALAQDTPIIIMDEPFSFLDVASRIEILALLKDIASAQNKAILYSTHEVSQALKMADRIALFLKGDDGLTEMVEDTPDNLIEGGYIDRIFESKRVAFDRNIKDFTEIKTL